jgi:TRAP-type C4-dicarboxylate transport system permease small subunit
MSIIVIDVGGRAFFNMPLRGTVEIVRNSVPGIAFFLLPWAIVKQTLLRSTMIIDRVPPGVVRIINILTYSIGFLILFSIVTESWEPFVRAFVNNEFEGEGALRVPTWPTRLGILIGCSLSAWHCLHLVISKLMQRKFADYAQVNENLQVAGRGDLR